MKSAKKTLFIIVTLSVITAILMTAASAEGLYYNASAASIGSGAVTSMLVQTASAAQLPQEQEQGVGADAAPAAVTTPAAEKSTAAAPPADGSEASDTAPAGVVVSDIKSSLITEETLQEAVFTAGQSIADFSAQYDGYRYVYGSASPKSGFDCSGLVYYVYGQFGFSLPRTARAQFKNGADVDMAGLQPGDLVFFATNGGHTITHVGIYLGNGSFIHAATSRQGVIISSLDSSYWVNVFVGAKRIVTPQAAMQLAYQ
jgi:cell wall-associated NlpC family hydrolase